MLPMEVTKARHNDRECSTAFARTPNKALKLTKGAEVRAPRHSASLRRCSVPRSTFFTNVPSQLSAVLSGPRRSGVGARFAGRQSLAAIVVGLSLAGAVWPSLAHACSNICVSVTPGGKYSLKGARVVFIAEVVEVVEVKDGVDAILQVQEVYKGKVGPSVIVESGWGGGGWGADCRYSFVKGGKYLFFSAPDSLGRVGAPGPCDRDPRIEADPKLTAWVRKHKRRAVQARPSAPSLK